MIKKIVIIGTILIIAILSIVIYFKSTNDYDWEGTYLYQRMEDDYLVLDKLIITKDNDKLHLEYLYDARHNDVIMRGYAEFDVDDTGREIEYTYKHQTSDGLESDFQIILLKNGDIKFRVNPSTSGKNIEDIEYMILEKQ